MISENSYDSGYMAGWEDRKAEDLQKIRKKLGQTDGDIELLALLHDVLKILEEF